MRTKRDLYDPPAYYGKPKPETSYAHLFDDAKWFVWIMWGWGIIASLIVIVLALS